MARKLAAVLLVLAGALLARPATADRPSVIVVVGAPGTDEYGAEFERWAGKWAAAAEKGDAKLVRLGPGGASKRADGESDRELLRKAIESETRSSKESLWLVLIGHGTFDGRQAKFNLRGPDVAAAELAEWLEPCERPLAVINCASASGPFINRLSAPGRVVVSATRSGFEVNFARFGRYLAEEIVSLATDIDKDEQVSLLEAFLAASVRTAEFYRREARLATEHALIDDNGDGLGTPADWFRGVRATRRAKDGALPDGLRANQYHLVRSARDRSMPARVRERRDALELELAGLREEKKTLDADTYYARLEPIVLQLARLYESLERPPERPRKPASPGGPGSTERP